MFASLLFMLLFKGCYSKYLDVDRFARILFALVLLKSLAVIFLQRMGWLHLGPTSAIHQVHFIQFINFK